MTIALKREKALKLAANAGTGFLGSRYARFRNPKLEARITSEGRDTLTTLMSIIQQTPNARILAADTDGVYVDATKESVEVILSEAREKIPDMKLREDFCFDRILFSHAKASAYRPIGSGKLVFKGMEGLNKRIHCDWLRNIMLRVLEVVFKVDPWDDAYQRQEANRSIRGILDECSRAIRNTITVPVDELLFCSTIHKPLKDYKGVTDTSPPAVGRRADKRGYFVRPGTILCMLACYHPVTGKPWLVDEREFWQRPSLRIDAEYYLSKQAFPVLFRLLCERARLLTRHELVNALDTRAERSHSPENFPPRPPPALGVYKCNNCNHETSSSSLLWTNATGDVRYGLLCYECGMPFDIKCIVDSVISMDDGDRTKKRRLTETRDALHLDTCAHSLGLGFNRVSEVLNEFPTMDKHYPDQKDIIHRSLERLEKELGDPSAKRQKK